MCVCLEVSTRSHLSIEGTHPKFCPSRQAGDAPHRKRRPAYRVELASLRTLARGRTWKVGGRARGIQGVFHPREPGDELVDGKRLLSEYALEVLPFTTTRQNFP